MDFEPQQDKRAYYEYLMRDENQDPIGRFLQDYMRACLDRLDKLDTMARKGKESAPTKFMSPAEKRAEKEAAKRRAMMRVVQ